jgi:hypothetical protein
MADDPIEQRAVRRHGRGHADDSLQPRDNPDIPVGKFIEELNRHVRRD